MNLILDSDLREVGLEIVGNITRQLGVWGGRHHEEEGRVSGAAELVLVGLFELSQVLMRNIAIAINNLRHLVDLGIDKGSLLGIESKSLELEIVQPELVTIRILGCRMLV